ncbi:hypothetical protein EDD41_2378 [Luteococcus japonicus]|uniref:TnsA endonuclease-like protein n=1 Tax=Luteococcus japonicus TaxID=33984 RepID=A0A3N1ZW94_9ACTN|nr:TnsA-like heteromeric transposase endonuclease subunit [Luteococcus japonicus]ROR55124.1 hypothetical protein EDD41_2378 [Luteococcus japonicus]
MTDSIGGPAMGPDPSCPQWVIKTRGALRQWRWCVDGAPPLQEMQPCRDFVARALSKHLPASPFCTTTGDLVPVESGLEADLLRAVDCDPAIRWLVSQPLKLRWPDGSHHTPDLLTVTAHGDVTVWDVRPEHRQDSRFRAVAEKTAEACRSVGWGYEVFSDEHERRRLNLQWLSHSRRLPAGTRSIADQMLAELDSEPVPLRRLFTGSEADLRLRVAWHLIWTGALDCDLDEPLDQDSRVRRACGS